MTTPTLIHPTSARVASVADHLQEQADHLQEQADMLRHASVLMDDDVARQDLTLILVGRLLATVSLPHEDAMRLASEQAGSVYQWLGRLSSAPRSAA